MSWDQFTYVFVVIAEKIEKEARKIRKLNFNTPLSIRHYYPSICIYLWVLGLSVGWCNFNVTIKLTCLQGCGSGFFWRIRILFLYKFGSGSATFFSRFSKNPIWKYRFGSESAFFHRAENRPVVFWRVGSGYVFLDRDP